MNIETYIREKNPSEDINFIYWMRIIETIIYTKLNLYLTDLPDEDYHTMFEEKYKPQEVANMIINSINEFIKLL